MTAHSEHRNEQPNTRGIVVAVDGSAPSDTALEWAVREAASRKSPLTVVHVVRPPMVVAWPEMPPGPAYGESLEDHGRAVLDETRGHQRGDDGGRHRVERDVDARRDALHP